MKSIVARLLVLLSLIVCVFYTIVYVYIKPQTGLVLRQAPTGWQVSIVEVPNSAIQEGDILLEVAGRDIVRGNNDVAPFVDQKPGAAVPVRLVRNGTLIRTTWLMPPQSTTWQLSRWVVLLFVAPFWIAGTVVLHLSRTRRLMGVFFLGYAVWVASGIVSRSLLGYSSQVLHATTWLLLPVAIQLHWQVPAPIGRRWPRWLTVSFYGVAGVMAVLELLSIPPRGWFFAALLIQVIGSSGLLFWRIWSRSAAQLRAVRIMVIGLTLAFVPGLGWVVMSFATKTTPTFVTTGLSILSLVIWPAFYIYAICRKELGRLEAKTRRALTLLAFVSMYLNTIAFVIAVMGAAWNWASWEIGLYILLSLVMAIAIMLLFERFRQWIEYLIHGQFDEAIVSASSLFSRLMADTMDMDSLERLIGDSLRQEMHVVEMALYIRRDNGNITLQFARGVDAPEELSQMLLSRLGAFLSNGTKCLRWARVALPLLVHQEVVGVWVLGSRERDDFYSRSQIEQLQNLANAISAMIEIENQRRTLEKQLEALISQEKMASLGRMAAAVAHQMNNPLQIVQGALEAHVHYNEQVLANANGSDEYSWLSMAYEQVIYMAQLVRSITRISRPTAQEMVEVDVADQIEQALTLAQRRLDESQVEVRTELHAANLVVRCFPSDLIQVLANLIDNACDAMSEVDGKRILTIRTRQRGDFIEIRIADTGPGIPPNQLKNIFEPFFTTKPEGSGFGLTISYNIIERNGGQLMVESQVGKGSKFTVRLPPPNCEHRRI